MGNGLAALMGVLKGTGEFPEGLVAGDKQRLAEENLAATERHRKTLEDQAYIDLPPEMSTKFGLGSTRVRKELAPLFTTMFEKDAARETDARKNALLASGILDAGKTQAEGPVPEGQYGPGSPVNTIDPQFAALAKMVPGLGHEKAGPAVVELLKERAAGGDTVGVPHVAQDGTSVVRTNKRTGAFIDATPTGLERPEAKGPFQRSDIEGLLNERGWAKEMPGYREAYANVARQIPVSGVGVYGAGQFVIPPPPGPGGAPKPSAPAAKGPATPPGGLPAAPLVSTEQPLSAEQTANLGDFRTLRGQLDKIESIYNPSVSGPIQGRLGFLRTATGLGASTEEANLRAEIARVQNSLIYLKSGKQINEAEYERLKRELPDINDPEVVFRAKLSGAKTLLDTMLNNRQAEFKARQFRGGAPEGTSAPAAGGAVKWGRDPQGRPVRVQ